MQKGTEITRVIITPATVRAAAKGETFTPTVAVGVTRAARDGVEVFTGASGEANVGRNPRICELARELLALVAQEIATEGKSAAFVATDGSNYTTFTPGEPVTSARPELEPRPAPPPEPMPLALVPDEPPPPEVLNPAPSFGSPPAEDPEPIGSGG